jgi:lipoprotein NlpD
VHHIVEPGDTLYSIAWRYNLDYKKLAKSNGIGASYRIFPGQKISLNTQVNTPSAPQVRTNQPKNTEIPKTVSTHKVGVESKQIRLKNETPKIKNAPVAKTKLAWRWPAEGKLLKRFSGKNGLSKGIDIGGNLGEPVLAASSGRVVYAGDGLRGYGKLIIVKHSDKFLSAYAHCRKIIVREGDEVTVGTKIAEMGSSGTNTVKLHFEIRFDGQPVDPLKYLPPG